MKNFFNKLSSKNKMLISAALMVISALFAIGISCLTLTTNILLSVGTILVDAGLTSIINTKFYEPSKRAYCKKICESYCDDNKGKIDIANESDGLKTLSVFKYRIDRLVAYSLTLLGDVAAVLFILSSPLVVFAWLAFWSVLSLYAVSFEIIEFGATAVDGVIKIVSDSKRKNNSYDANRDLESENSYKKSDVPFSSLFVYRGDVAGLVPTLDELSMMKDVALSYVGISEPKNDDDPKISKTRHKR